jgi:hypothetical protein
VWIENAERGGSLCGFLSNANIFYSSYFSLDDHVTIFCAAVGMT